MKKIPLLFGVMCFMVGCSDRNGKPDAYGNFETVEVSVASEVQGKLVQFTVDEGKTLNAGDNVGLIDTIQLALKRDQLVAQRNGTRTKISNILSQIDVQEEQKKTLLTDKDRIVKLLKDNATPAKQLDDIEGKIKVMDSQIASIKTQNSAVLNDISALDKQIDQMTDQLKRCKITNPIHGTVLEKYTEPSEIVTPGRVLYKIADMDQMILRVYISGSQLTSVKLGQKVKVFIDKNKDEKETMEGVIGWVSPQAEFTPKIIQTKEERVNLVYAMKVNVKNDGRLKIGMPGEVSF